MAQTHLVAQFLRWQGYRHAGRIAGCGRLDGSRLSAMQHLSLISFLNGDQSPEAFGDEISGEVDACQHGIKTGGVGYILAPEGPDTVVTRDHARRLLEALLSGKLAYSGVNYAAECLIMSDSFDFGDKAVVEAI